MFGDFSVLSNLYRGFLIFREISSGFSVSSRPQCPSHFLLHTLIIWKLSLIPSELLTPTKTNCSNNNIYTEKKNIWKLRNSVVNDFHYKSLPNGPQHFPQIPRLWNYKLQFINWNVSRLQPLINPETHRTECEYCRLWGLVCIADVHYFHATFSAREKPVTQTVTEQCSKKQKKFFPVKATFGETYL